MLIIFSVVSFHFFFFRYTAVEKAQILKKLEKCLNTPNLLSYQKSADQLRRHPKFGAYFLKNWDACKHMWARHGLRDIITNGQLANNFLESSHQKIELTLSCSSSINGCHSCPVWNGRWQSVAGKTPCSMRTASNLAFNDVYKDIVDNLE